MQRERNKNLEKSLRDGGFFKLTSPSKSDQSVIKVLPHLLNFVAEGEHRFEWLINLRALKVL